MARNTPHTEKKQQTTTTTNQTRQQASTGSTSSSSAGNASAKASTPDRERSIETQRDTRESRESRESREPRGGAGLSRRPASGQMLSTTSDPFSLMQRMSEDMDRLFQQFGFGRVGLGLSPFLGSTGSDLSRGSDFDRSLRSVWAPQVETFRRGDTLVVRADLPGMKKDDVDVNVEGDVLTITGERSDEHEDERDGYYRSERSYGSFYRAIPLPDGVNAEQCDASFKDGVLEITFKAPKEQQNKARKVPIR